MKRKQFYWLKSIKMCFYEYYECCFLQKKRRIIFNNKILCKWSGEICKKLFGIRKEYFFRKIFAILY